MAGGEERPARRSGIGSGAAAGRGWAGAGSRHTCASLAIAAGADVKVLQRMLGHASAALTLDRYGHLMPGQAESVAERLDQMARAAGTAPLGSVEPIDRTGSAAR